MQSDSNGAYLSGDPPTEATFCPAAVATFVLRAVVAGQVAPFFFFEQVAALATVSAFAPRR